MTTTHTLHFKWTISRGRDTYGYNICSLWVDGKKDNSCKGGGYDMEGTCFGEWIQNNFADQLLALKDKPYGLYIADNGRPVLDGACGFECMRGLFNLIGGTIKQTESRTNSTLYIATVEVQ